MAKIDIILRNEFMDERPLDAPGIRGKMVIDTECKMEFNFECYPTPVAPRDFSGWVYFGTFSPSTFTETGEPVMEEKRAIEIVKNESVKLRTALPWKECEKLTAIDFVAFGRDLYARVR